MLGMEDKKNDLLGPKEGEEKLLRVLYSKLAPFV